MKAQTIRLDDEARDVLKDQAAKTGLSLSAWLRVLARRIREGGVKIL